MTLTPDLSNLPTVLPTVSIIIATYNRSNVLRVAIQSALRSSFHDWEMIVVGDACTDDTADVIQSFNDARIRFINLEQNIGEQSGPNNMGVQHARGRYIAFLNHDDLWLPNHLSEALRAMAANQADFVFTLGITILPDGKRWLTGATRSRYTPDIFVPASTWLVKREWMERLGGWRAYRLSFNVPSQDFVYRAWKAGARLFGLTRCTVILITSGNRRQSYATRQSAEHVQFYQGMLDDPAFTEREVTEAALTFWQRSEGIHIGLHVYRIGRKGATLDRFRAIRGLPALRRHSNDST